MTTQTPVLERIPGTKIEVLGPALAADSPGLTIVPVKTDVVKPHPDNPRNGDTDAIIESLRTNGLYRPLYVQRSTGHIVAGNHTYAAMLELGATAVPVMWLDVDDDKALRIMLADNRLADLGQYDNGLLVQLLQDLDSLTGTGYDERAIERLINQIDAPLDLLQGLDPHADSDAVDHMLNPNRMNDLFTIPYGLDAEQRAVVLGAVKVARAHHPGSSGADAITLIAQQYLNAQEDSG